MNLLRSWSFLPKEQIRKVAESINLELFQFVKGRDLEGRTFHYFYICEHEERKAIQLYYKMSDIAMMAYPILVQRDPQQSLNIAKVEQEPFAHKYKFL